MTDLMKTASLPTDPLLPHLLDIVSRPESDGLILAGGFGMRLKQAALEEQIKEGRTLIPSVPPARATQDLDLFLNIELWIKKEKGKAIRAMLESLDYEVIKDYENLQFGKLRDSQTDRLLVKIDLHAREPKQGEAVAFDRRRVGKGTGQTIDGEKDEGVGLHGRTTPEAFAIDDGITHLQVAGHRTDGTKVQSAVSVPHPYTSLNMKIKAAHDWLRVNRGEVPQKAQSPKHILDVYLLTAMMLPSEVQECQAFAIQYADYPMAQEIRRNAIDLFADPTGPGPIEIRRQITDLPYDYDTFWDALQSVLTKER